MQPSLPSRGITVPIRDVRRGLGLGADTEQVIDSVKLRLCTGSAPEPAEGSVRCLATRRDAEAHNEVLIKKKKKVQVAGCLNR